VGLRELENEQVRTYIYAQRAKHAAKASLAQYDAQIKAQGEQEKRALLRKLLRAGSYDLSSMGLA
jgi:hypothetical protein